MKNQLVTYFLFVILSLFSQVSLAKLTAAEQAIVDNSRQVSQFKGYFKDKKQARFIDKLSYQIVKSNQISLNKKTGYLEHKNNNESASIWIFKGNTILLNTSGKILALSWKHGGLDDLSIFSKFSKMRTLRLYNNIFSTDTLEIENLPFLEELNISYNSRRKSRLTEVNLGKRLNKLRVLILKKMPLTSLRLTNLKQLRRLGLLLNLQLTTLKDLGKLKHLRWLDIERTSITTIPSMKRFPKLEWLNAMDSKIITVKDLRHAKRLKYINLHRTAAGQNTEPFPPQIEIIQVGGAVLTKMPNFRNLKKLRQLSIIGGLRINKIENLEGLSNLKKLDLRFTAIKKIEGLNDLKNLEELSFKNTPITKIEGLEKLVKLKILNFKRTPIAKIEGLSSQKQLSILYLDESEVKKVENIQHLTNLELIDLMNAPVVDYDYTKTINLKTRIRLAYTPYIKRIKKENPDLYKKLRRAKKI